MDSILTTFFFRGEELPVFLVRSKRRTMGLTIDRQNRIVVKAPYGVSERELLELVERHSDWIRKHLVIQIVKSGGVTEETISGRFYDGALYPYLGGGLRIFFAEDVNWNSETLRCFLRLYPTPLVEADPEDTRPAMSIFGELIVKGREITPERARITIERVVRKHAGELLREKVELWSQRMRISYGRVAVKDGTSRWGSCSSKGNINLQWRLVMMPEAILDYVVVHELCHRREMNHSERFWREVEHFLPDYKKRRQWLKDNGVQFLQW